MKRIINIIMMLAAAATFASCSGNVDPADLKLSIRADKASIAADGTDAVTFTVSQAGEDVSASSGMHITWECEGKSGELKAGTNTFSTNVPGTYTFSATYSDGKNQYQTEDKVTVTATAVASLTSGWLHKMLAMEFTSVWCTYCPILATAIDNVMWGYPGRIIPVAFHDNSMGEDPMTLPLNGKIYEKVATGEGLPLFALDFRKSSQHIVNEYAKIVSEIDMRMEQHVPDCGVAIETSYDAGKLDVTARFKSDVAAEYRYHIFLIEDAVEGTQAGHEGTDPYVHKNVLTTMSADNVYGSRLNDGKALAPGTEYTAKKSFDIPAGTDISNMTVVVSILDSEDGSAYECDNSNCCKAGQSVGYLYEKDYVPAQYERRVCVMEFTGTWCAQCPEGATTINYLVNKAYKDKAFALAFHNDDEYALPQEQELFKMFKWGGYPAYVTDMRDCGLLNEGGCSTSIEKSLYDEKTQCGASVSCRYNESDGIITVTAGIVSGKEQEYRLAVYVIENKVVGKQTLSTGEVQKDYIHRHVVRKMLSASVKGDNIGTLPARRSEIRKYSFKPDASWNKDNLSVAVLVIDAEGKVNNMAICAAVNGFMDYGQKK